MTIHQAVSTGNPLIVECVIDTRPDVLEHKNTLGRTPLLQAAANGSLEIVKLLTLKGAKISARSYTTDNSSMAIHLAADNGHVEIVNHFLAIAPEQLEAKDKDGDTPLARAAYNGRENVLKFLLAKNANIEAPGYRDRTPLLRAAANGHVGSVKILLNAGANIFAKSNSQDFEKTAIILATVFGYLETVEYLLSVEPLLVNTINIHNDTLICYAALGGHASLIAFFLEKCSADIEIVGRAGRTPILQAASMGHLDAVKFLKERGANIYAKSAIEDDEQTVVHLAARFGYPNVVAYFGNVDKALLTVVDKQGRTPCDIAKTFNKSSVIKLFESAS